DEHKQKRNILRKLNIYWGKKKTASLQSYNEVDKRNTWPRKLVLVICLAASVGLFIRADGIGNVAGIFEKLDYFRISSITVSGCRKASTVKVRNSSGLQVSSSLLAVDSEAVTQAIKAENKWVKTVDVIKHWPDKVVLQIGEFVPYALLAVGAEEHASLFYLDQKGESFAQVEGGMDLDYPVISGLEQVTDSAERVKLLKESLHFLRLVRGNDPNLPAQSISEIHLTSDHGIIVHLVEHPFPIFYGSGEVRKRYIRLKKVLEVLYRPRKTGMDIARVTYIKMDYLTNKVIVGYRDSG
ncbi:MAG: FtsQ-type POTRA domain-containing protein, partial [Desulfobacterales bacterium]|nr:FtsQ-type POTRA domain-containing protein [Desulfobacterales bacterium]